MQIITNEKGRRASMKDLSKLKALRTRVIKMTRDYELEDQSIENLLNQRIDLLTRAVEQHDQDIRTPAAAFELLTQLRSIPEMLIKARLAAGWTLTELATHSKTNRQQLTRYEKRGYKNISLSKAIAIASALTEALERRAQKAARCSIDTGVER